MLTIESPYYWKNPEWTYIDPRVPGRVRLTDKATPKAIQSFINHNAHYTYPYFTSPNADEIFSKYARDDIEDFKKNKDRYTLEKDEEGTQRLVAIDGKPIEI